MFIFTMLLFGKLEPANLMNLNDKWTLGVKTLWANVGYTSGISIDQYFVSAKIGKTFTIGIEGNGARNTGTADSTLTTYSWNGSVGLVLSKYFRARNPLSSFVSLTPSFTNSYRYDKQVLNADRFSRAEYSGQFYRVNLDAGVEYFFTCWGKNLSAKLKTSLVSASRRYSQQDVYNYNYGSYNGASYNNRSDNIYFYFPMTGYLTSYICLHF